MPGGGLNRHCHCPIHRLTKLESVHRESRPDQLFMSDKNIPLRASMCATCPFREGSKYAYLAPGLTMESMTTSRICHSTGSNNAINKRTGVEPHVCRGSRDIQLKVMTILGMIAEPTDEAWNDAREVIGLERTVVADPVKNA